jgi:hypothetical protein
VNDFSEQNTIDSKISQDSYVSKDFEKKAKFLVSKLYSKVRTLEIENKKLKQQIIDHKYIWNERVHYEDGNHKDIEDLVREFDMLKMKYEETVKILEEKEQFYVTENDHLRNNLLEMKSTSSNINKTIEIPDTYKVSYINSMFHRYPFQLYPFFSYLKISPEIEELKSEIHLLKLEKVFFS